jgi:3-methyladenine DNA glycosylase/8-oxoguanine DNA glycosylase
MNQLEHVHILNAHGLDLAVTVAPVAWGKGRWPTVDWIDDVFLQVRHELATGQLALVRAWQPQPDEIHVAGFVEAVDAEMWLKRCLGWQRNVPSLDELVISALAEHWPGMRPFAHGSLSQSIMTVIIGQGVTVQAGAVMERRVAEIHSPGIAWAGRRFIPFPTPEQLAETPVERLRETGLTWRRAEGIVKVARIAAEGTLPSDDEARANPEEAMRQLRELPMIGQWSAAAALLWGIGSDDAHVTGDVALLRAAQHAYGRTDLTLKSLDHLAESWRPARAWAARWLWLDLFGPAKRSWPEGTDRPCYGRLNA